MLYGERITSTLLHVDFLLELAADDLTKVRVLALSCPESGASLNALPLSSIGLRMDDDVIRIVVGLRLGLALCHLHSCSDCSAEVNEDGIHGKFELSLLQRLPSMTSSSALLKQLKSPVTWSHLVCTDQMESVLMELQCFPGRGRTF